MGKHKKKVDEKLDFIIAQNAEILVHLKGEDAELLRPPDDDDGGDPPD